MAGFNKHVFDKAFSQLKEMPLQMRRVMQNYYNISNPTGEKVFALWQESFRSADLAPLEEATSQIPLHRQNIAWQKLLEELFWIIEAKRGKKDSYFEGKKLLPFKSSLLEAAEKLFIGTPDAPVKEIPTFEQCRTFEGFPPPFLKEEVIRQLKAGAKADAQTAEKEVSSEPKSSVNKDRPGYLKKKEALRTKIKEITKEKPRTIL